VADILGTITYGHHWKEYSPKEISQYFQSLSPDFKVEVRTYNQPPDGALKKFIIGSLSLIPIFRSDIEAVVHLPAKNQFSAAVPQLPMHKPGHS
jgi:2-polyprenyl-6-hydroxyphenyl methylase/3-demethylubiquinone-9 3-methyltransferase